MSLATLRKWGDRAIILSDTMISDPNAAHPNLIPGQLKAIVISERLSMAYAGRTGIALTAIRRAHRALNDGSSLRQILEILVEASSLQEDATDFLVVSHFNNIETYKIWNGQIARGGDSYWIGDGDAIGVLEDLAEEQISSPELPEYVAQQETKLFQAFFEILTNPAFPTVGGLYFNLLASPVGHCYNNHAGSFSWDTVSLDRIPTQDYQDFVKGGTTSWQYSLTSAAQRGVGVTGAFLPQPSLGFVYNPLVNDYPLMIRDATLETVNAEVNRVAQLAISGTT